MGSALQGPNTFDGNTALRNTKKPTYTILESLKNFMKLFIEIADCCLICNFEYVC